MVVEEPWINMMWFVVEDKLDSGRGSDGRQAVVG
jgi:hypothetical protein